MPKIYDKVCGKTFRVSSKVRVGKVGSPRWRAYCARSAKIKGGQVDALRIKHSVGGGNADNR